MTETYSFGEWMAQRRKALDMTQRELAAQTNCALATIKKIETDERRPSRDLAEALAVALQVPADTRQKFVECARGLRAVDVLKSIGETAQAEPISTPTVNIPAHHTPFIGRDAELKQIMEYLADPACRLLTLVGQGGIGKTRLAIEAAHRIQTRFVDGAAFVSLAPVTDPNLVLATIADSLHIPLNDAPVDQLNAYLRTKSLLLILDNCEQISEGIAWLPDLIVAAPGLKVLVTSQEPLQLTEEWVYRVGALSEAQASKLFQQSAQRSNNHFNPAGQETAITVICNLVESLPLAIELASSWTSVMSCAQIAEHIQRDIDFLSASLRNLPIRQRSIRAVFNYSWELLTATQQIVLMKLSIFRGGWAAKEAEAVTGVGLWELRRLVEKSLVRVTANDRYDLHELTRHYAADRLRVAGLETTVQRQHCQTFLALVEHISSTISAETVPELFAANIRKMNDEIDNFRAALVWAVENDQGETAVRLANALFFLWIGRAHWQEGLRWTDRILSLYPNLPAALRAKMLGHLAILLHRTGSYERALSMANEGLLLAEQAGDRMMLAQMYQEMSFQTTDYHTACSYLEKSLALRREIGHQWGVALTLQLLGDRARIQGDFDRAEAFYEESATILHETGDRNRIAYPLGNLGRIAFERGDLPRARSAFEKSIAICRASNNIVGIADWLLQLAVTALAQSDYQCARASLRENMTLCQQVGNFPEMTDNLILSVGLALALKEPERAAKLLGASDSALRQHHNVLEPTSRRRYEQYVAETSSLLDPNTFKTLYNAGRNLSVDEAATYMLEGQ